MDFLTAPAVITIGDVVAGGVVRDIVVLFVVVFVFAVVDDVVIVVLDFLAVIYGAVDDIAGVVEMFLCLVVDGAVVVVSLLVMLGVSFGQAASLPVVL